MMPTVVAVVAAILLFCFLAYQETARKRRSFLALRLAASAVACGSLAALSLPASSVPQTGHAIILLTEGYDADSVRLLITRGSIPIFATEQLAAGHQDIQASPVADWPDFARRVRTDSLFVFGNGLPPDALAALAPQPFTFIPARLKSGVTAVFWKTRLSPGEPLRVQGNYVNRDDKPLSLKLQLSGTVRDSTTVDARQSKPFTLAAIPRGEASLVAQLLTYKEKNLIASEPVPAVVDTAVPLRLLLLAASPDFENTYLKNFLSRTGASIASVTTVTRNNRRVAYNHLPGSPGNPAITPAFLGRFDILLTDEQTLEALRPNVVSLIRNAIKEGGLGMVIKLDPVVKDDFFYSRFFKKKLADTKPGMEKISERGPDSTNYALPVDGAVSIQPGIGIQSLLENNRHLIYAARMPYGKGNLVATGLQNTFTVGLSGDQSTYRRWWTTLLNSASRTRAGEEDWIYNPRMPIVNEPVEFIVYDTTGAGTATINGVKLQLKQDSLLPGRWHGTYWPGTDGWHPLPQLTHMTGRWYAAKKSDWSDLHACEIQTATQKYVKNYPAAADGKKVDANRHSINLPLCWLLLFLSACIFLWVEQKLG